MCGNKLSHPREAPWGCGSDQKSALRVERRAVELREKRCATGGHVARRERAGAPLLWWAEAPLFGMPNWGLGPLVPAVVGTYWQPPSSGQHWLKYWDWKEHSKPSGQQVVCFSVHGFPSESVPPHWP